MPDNPPPEQKEEAPPKPPRRRSALRWLVLLIVLAGVATGALYLRRYFQTYETTDDAQIDGDIYPITSRISGSVRAVYVQENQRVKAGQLLVELDPSDYNISLAQARAALNESRTQLA